MFLHGTTKSKEPTANGLGGVAADEASRRWSWQTLTGSFGSGRCCIVRDKANRGEEDGLSPASCRRSAVISVAGLWDAAETTPPLSG